MKNHFNKTQHANRPCPGPTAVVRRLPTGPVEQLVGPLVDRLAQEPWDPSSWVLLGKSYDNLGEPQRASHAYRQPIKYGHSDPQVAAALKAAEGKFVLTVLGQDHE